MILTILTVILVLSFLVFMHELGHYLAAKNVGVRVMEFSIGFPPKIVSKLIGKTEYMISLIPLGGYVRLLGQNIDDEDPDEPENYASKSIFQRLYILIAGPAMNLVVALLFMWLVLYTGHQVPSYLAKPAMIDGVKADSEAAKLDLRKNDLILAVNGEKVSNWRDVQTQFQKSGDPIITLDVLRNKKIIQRSFSSNLWKGKNDLGWKINTEPVVGGVSRNAPAESAGILSGDRIISINDSKIETWSQISPAIQNSKGAELKISLLRQGQEFDMALKPIWNENQQHWIIGIGSPTIHVSETFVDAVIMGTKQVYIMTGKTFQFLYRLITGKESSKSVGGPIMIAQMVGQAAQSGLNNLLFLAGFISLQFAIFNLLPIPALDGGHIFFLGLEKLKGSTLSKKFRLSMQKAGFSLLLVLILFISIQDGLRLFKG